MSPFGKINLADLAKGVLIAFGTVFLLGVYQILNTGRFPTMPELGSLAMAGLAAALSYVLKNFFTNSKNMLAKKE